MTIILFKESINSMTFPQVIFKLQIFFSSYSLNPWSLRIPRRMVGILMSVIRPLNSLLSCNTLTAASVEVKLTNTAIPSR